MPHLRGVTVHITDSRGQNFPEWGIQYLRQGIGGRKVSAYVQSTTDVAFQISLQPNLPFTESPVPDITGGKVFTNKPRHLTTGSEDLSTTQNHKGETTNALSSPLRPSTTPQSQSLPGFAFLAILYIDGRSIPERKIIVYLDPTDKDFCSPDGKVVFKHRWVQSADGRMTEHAWVFKEKTIETVFDKLMIAETRAKGEDQDDDALIKAMESSGFNDQGKTKRGSKVGQIVVELRRIVLENKRLEANYHPHHREGQDEDVDMEGAPRDIIHATGLIQKNAFKTQPLRVVDYRPYLPSEGPYATFQFFYRSQEQLQRFHFPGFVSLPTTKPARTTRALNARMADLTPLSISLPLNEKTKKVQCDRDSYEAKIGRKAFKPDDNTRYNFGSEYRDIQSAPSSAVDGASKAKKLSQHAANLLLSMADKSAGNSDVNALPPKTSQSTAEERASINIPRVSNLEHKPQPQGHARQSFNSDSSISITARPSPSVPPSTEAINEQAAKMTDKGGYRPTARESHTSDQDEEDTDHDCATESDLESHPDDDDVNYTVDPAAEDDRIDTLRSRFKEVRIRKRGREDGEDVAGDGNETDDTTRLDGGLEHEGLRGPFFTAEEEEMNAHVGKKSRIAKKKEERKERS